MGSGDFPELLVVTAEGGGEGQGPEDLCVRAQLMQPHACLSCCSPRVHIYLISFAYAFPLTSLGHPLATPSPAVSWYGTQSKGPSLGAHHPPAHAPALLFV